MGVISVQDLYKRLKLLDNLGCFDPDKLGFYDRNFSTSLSEIKQWISDYENGKIYMSTGQ